MTEELGISPYSLPYKLNFLKIENYQNGWYHLVFNHCF